MQPASELEICIGAYVTVIGLKTRSDLNGTFGTVESILSNGRLQVRSISPQLATTISVLPSNVRLTMSKSAASNIDADGFVLNMSPCLILAPTKLFFYPFGNTPAKDLAKFFNLQSARFSSLLLGCGDPRNVFFTCWSLSKSQCADETLLEFTMCDMEVSIFARNLLVIKMIVDEVDIGIVWSIFFSMKLDQTCLEILQKCASELVENLTSVDERHDTLLGRIMGFYYQEASE